jgi:hypothetical protein
MIAVRIVGQKAVAEFSERITVQEHRTDDAHIFRREHAGIHERLLDDVEREPADVPQPVAQRDRDNDIAPVIMELAIDFNRIADTWPVCPRGKKCQQRFQGRFPAEYARSISVTSRSYSVRAARGS